MARSALYPKSVTPGIPKLPEVPEGWSAPPMGSLLRKVQRPATLEDDREYQLVNAKRSRGGIVAREQLRGDQIKVKTQFHTRADDFLVSRRQIIHGACGVVPPSLDEAVVSNEYDTLLVESEKLLLPYLDAFSHTPYFQRCTFHSSIGVDVEKMVFKLDRFLGMPMLLPPLPEQRKIAEILSSVDEAIQATQAVIEQTRRVKEGLLQELLTKGIGHTRFKKTAIGEIPESWEVGTLSALTTKITDGTHQGVKTVSSEQGSKRFLYVNCVRPDKIIWNNAAWLEETTFVNISKGRIPVRGSVLYTAVGSVGYAAVVDTDEQFSFQRHLAILYPKHDRLLGEFLAASLNSAAVLRRVRSVVVGNAQPSITLREIKNLRIPIPSMREQKEIADVLATSTRTISALESQVANFGELKAGLLQDLLTGKVRVSV